MYKTCAITSVVSGEIRAESCKNRISTSLYGLSSGIIDRTQFSLLIGVVVLSAILGTQAAQLRLGFDPGDLLPQHHPFVEVHNRYHRNFSETNVLSVMVEARQGTIFSVPALAKVWELTEAVDALPGVNHDQVTSVAHRSTRWARVRAGGVIESDPIMLRAPPACASR